MKKHSLLIAIVVSTWIGQLLAGQGSNECTTVRNSPVAAICEGMYLPSDKVRNYHANSHQLECSSTADHFIRRPQKYDFAAWNKLRKSGEDGQQKAFKMRQSLPDIAWQGTIPYTTIETWSWEDCVYGSNATECGTHEECSTVTTTTTDAQGNETTREEEVCEEVANSCWYDEVQYASFQCSNEIMRFTASFLRDPSWTLSSDKYALFIPNKYDLLPGELEDVQVYNTSSRGTRLTPSVQVGDAWNKYDLSQISGSGVGAACRQNSDYKIDVKIGTIDRLTDKPSPNAFKIPTNVKGQEVDSLLWVDKQTKKGVVPKAFPRAILLADSSSAVSTAIAQHSRKVAEREMAKSEAGQNSNKDGASIEEMIKKDEGFFRNTIVRVSLYKAFRFWWDRKISLDIMTDDSNSIKPSTNILSKDQDVALSDIWQVDLISDINKNDLYKRSIQKLRPNRTYALHVSMYQKGIPFYAGDCDTKPAWDCGWYIPPPLKREPDDYFSKPLQLRFETSKDVDERAWYDKVNDLISPLSIFEWITYERPVNGGNK